MTSSRNAANNSALVSRESAGQTISRALRLYVGRGRRYSVKQLSNATGVKDRMIECAMCDPDNVDWRPMPVDALLSIALFLGADFTCEWLGLADQGAYDLPDDDDLDPARVAIGASEDSTEIVRAAADGAFCANDRVALAAVGRRKVARGMALVAQAKRVAA